MTPRRLIPAALFAALLLPAAVADAKTPSCTRDGFSLEQASGKVRIVTKDLKTNGVNETRREAVSACWTGTDWSSSEWMTRSGLLFAESCASGDACRRAA